MPVEAVTDDDIQQAAQRLLDGGLVACPTETVYGLGADAENPAAIAKIYQAKQRPASHPLIVHVAADADVQYWADTVSTQAHALMSAFWPGPLTLILDRAARVPSTVSGGQATIGIRCPSHPVAQRLLARFSSLKPSGQSGLAAPSANKFGQVSPTCADHVRAEFPELGSGKLLVLDGGASEVGIESTIVDVSNARQDSIPVLLRPGDVTAEQIANVLGIFPTQPDATSPQVSGSLKAHYAPRTPLLLVPAAELDAAVATCLRRASGVAQAQHAARVAVIRFDSVPSSSPLNVDYYSCAPSPQGYGRDLYAMLRRLDGSGYAALILERPPSTPAWRAVNDRICRAAAAFDSDQV